MPELKRTRRQRVAEYLGLSDPPPPADFQSGASINGVSVLDLNDVYNVLTSGAGMVQVSREEANRLPSIVSVRNRLQATVGGMPLEQRRKDGTVRPSRWLMRPNPSRPLVLEMADTIADMFYDGGAYWRVLQRGPGANGPGTGFPIATAHIPLSRIAPQPDGAFLLDGRSRLRADEVIQFEGVHAGILHEGAATAIVDSLRLARTAAMFTNSPFPLGYFQTRPDAIEPDATEQTSFLGEWMAARRRNTYGIVPRDLTLEFPDVDPAKLQLNEARSSTTADIGRGTGENLENLGLSTTSRTYFNGTQVRKDQLDFQVALYTEPIAQRLSMPDCTPSGDVVKFSTDEFLSVDELSRMQIYQLGLATGVYADADEVRQAEGKPPLTQEQKANRAAAGTAKVADGGRRATDPGASQAPASKGGNTK